MVVSIRCFFPKAPDWISEVGIMMVVAGLITIVIGSVAAHRSGWQSGGQRPGDAGRGETEMLQRQIYAPIEGLPRLH